MKSKKRNMVLMLFLMAVMLFGSVVQVLAAIPSISSARYLKTYPLSTGNDTYVYTSSSLATKGTSSPKRAYNAVIYASDEVYVYSMDSRSAYVSYPTSSGRKCGYIPTSAITTGNYSQDAKTSSAKITTYKRAGGAVYGNIAKGDTVYTVAQSGSYTQVIYPVGSRYKMGWISTSSYEQYLSGSTVNTESVHDPQGWLDCVVCPSDDTILVKGWAFDRDNLGGSLQIHVYVGGAAGDVAARYVIQADGYRPDVENVHPGVGASHGFSAEIKVGQTGAQSVYVYAVNQGGGKDVLLGIEMVRIKSSQMAGSSERPVDDGMYKIVSMIDKRHVWDISNASLEDGGNLQLWENNGSNAQKFWLAYNFNGFYTITNVKSNKAIDCAGGNSADGTNIQQYTSNQSDAQQWKLVETGDGGFTFICKCNGKAIDAAGGVAVNGTNIQMYQPNGTPAQKFMLVQTTQSQETDSPISSSGTSSTERSAVVSYMNAMASVEWTPRTSFYHWSYGSGNSHIWNAGTTYYGIPYSQKTRNTTLEAFQGKLSGKTYVGPSGKTTYMGSDCSSAVSMAYQKANAKFPVLSTHSMYPVSGYMKKVGSYNHYNSTSSTSICSKNGKDVMKNSYQRLQPGDLLLTNAGAHVMMVTESGDGYVKVTHQTTYNSSLRSTWRVNERWSFDSLYNARFIPVTMAAW